MKRIIVTVMALLAVVTSNAAVTKGKGKETDTRTKTEAEKAKDKEQSKLLDKDSHNGRPAITSATKAELSTAFADVLKRRGDEQTRKKDFDATFSTMKEDSAKAAVTAITILKSELNGPKGLEVSFALSRVINILALDVNNTLTGEGLANMVAETIVGKTRQATLLVALEGENGQKAETLDAARVLRQLEAVEEAMLTAKKANKPITGMDAMKSVFGADVEKLKGECI
jgi:hypothetical protein